MTKRTKHEILCDIFSKYDAEDLFDNTHFSETYYGYGHKELVEEILGTNNADGLKETNHKLWLLLHEYFNNSIEE